jgi:conjugal transfer pilus assembly protein TraW
MVKKVLSIYCSDCRRITVKALFPLLPVEKTKLFWLCLHILNTALCTWNAAFAKDLGTHGTIYSIEEQDPIQVVQQKLKGMEESGELERRNRELQSRTRASIERPKHVEGIIKATKDRIFYYDPTYVVKEDLSDHQAHRFAKKGERINPLETVSLSQNLIFFDGDDEEQLAWAKALLSQSTDAKPPKLILIKGMPLTLAENLGIPVYFDQSGILTKKLGIKHVPAIVIQEKLRLKIEEIMLPPSKELKVEGDI